MPEPPDPLAMNGRIAFVTGAARGIGAATALAFARAGARVALVDRDADALERSAEEARAVGADVVAMAADVADAAAITHAVAQVVDRWGRLDVLVNNAGIVRDATLADVRDEDWDATLDVNLTGAMVCARA